MSLPLLVQLATGNQQGRSQPDTGCANDPSNGAHPPRVAPAFGRQPRGAPDHRMSARHRIRASGTGEHPVPAARSWHEVTSTPRSADSRGGTCFRGLIPFYALTITAGSTVCEPSVNRGVPHRRVDGTLRQCWASHLLLSDCSRRRQTHPAIVVRREMSTYGWVQKRSR